MTDPQDRTKILGFYTLSTGLIEKDEVSRPHQKQVMLGLPIPMVRVGFMGRDDTVPPDLRLGGALLRDAALRVHRCADITAWGLYLDAENEELAERFYARKVGLRRTKTKPLVMYAPLSFLLPPAPAAP
jgi:hypothetical protein